MKAFTVDVKRTNGFKLRSFIVMANTSESAINKVEKASKVFNDDNVVLTAYECRSLTEDVYFNR